MAKKKKRSREAEGQGRAVDVETERSKLLATESLSGVPARVAKAAATAVMAVPLRPLDISQTKGSATAASSSVAKKEGESEVFKKLFHSDKEAKSSGRDLMMSTAGFRYGLA